VTAIELSDEVRAAFADRRPVVALESSVIAQGLPAPWNLESALRCEGIIRRRGAAPATVAMLAGRLRIGLAEAEIESLADPDRRVRKLGFRDLGIAAASGADGATTVAGTLRAAALAGIRFLATGGIGGVHRGQLDDVSSDLFELTRSQVAVFCAGVKMVLDVPATPPPLPAMDERTRVLTEYALSEVSTGRHLLSFLRAQLGSLGCRPLATIRDLTDGSRVRVAGLVIARQAPASASGFRFFTLADEDAHLDLIFRPAVVPRTRRVANHHPLLLVEGRLQNERGRVNLVVETVTALDGDGVPLHDDAAPAVAAPPSHDFH